MISLGNIIDALLVIITGTVAWIGYKEFVLKRRPYVMAEIAFKSEGVGPNEKWFFSAILINKGTYPGMARISKAVLKIGDDEYPSTFQQEVILGPSEKQLLAQLGNINANGLRKIRGQEYTKNRVEINLEIESKSINDKEFCFKTIYGFLVDVSGNEPLFSPIEQHMETVLHKGFSKLRFCLVYLLPLFFILKFFPYQDPIFLENAYPFSAAFSGTTINFRLGFSVVPSTIPAYTRAPLLSAIGIPKDLFAYETCVYHFSYFNIKGKPVDSDAISLDVRVKIGQQTIHLRPNSNLCLPPNNQEALEIYVGDALNDGNKTAELLKQNDKLQIDGMSKVLVKEKPVYGKIILFIGILFTFYPLYWAAIIAWNAVQKLIYFKSK